MPRSRTEVESFLRSFQDTADGERLRVLLNAKPEVRDLALVEARALRLLMLDLDERSPTLRMDPLGKTRVQIGTGADYALEYFDDLLEVDLQTRAPGQRPPCDLKHGADLLWDVQTRGVFMTVPGRQVDERLWQAFVWGLTSKTKGFVVITIEYASDSGSARGLKRLESLSISDVAATDLPDALGCRPIQVAERLGQIIKLQHQFRAEQAERTGFAAAQVELEDTLMALFPRPTEP